VKYHTQVYLFQIFWAVCTKKAVFTMMIAQEKVTEAAAQRKA